MDDDALRLATRFHEVYERLAPSFGYETRPETRAFDPTTPNGKLMVAVCDEIRSSLAQEAAETCLRELDDFANEESGFADEVAIKRYVGASATNGGMLPTTVSSDALTTSICSMSVLHPAPAAGRVFPRY